MTQLLSVLVRVRGVGHAWVQFAVSHCRIAPHHANVLCTAALMKLPHQHKGWQGLGIIMHVCTPQVAEHCSLLTLPHSLPGYSFHKALGWVSLFHVFQFGRAADIYRLCKVRFCTTLSSCCAPPSTHPPLPHTHAHNNYSLRQQVATAHTMQHLLTSIGCCGANFGCHRQHRAAEGSCFDCVMLLPCCCCCRAYPGSSTDAHGQQETRRWWWRASSCCQPSAASS